MLILVAGDAGTHLASWFGSLIKTAGGDDKCPPTLLLFKTVHQRCIFPAFYCVRELLQESIGKFKDKRGTWNVKIDLDPENMSYVLIFSHLLKSYPITLLYSFSHLLSIIHTKRQEAVEMLGEGPKFEFDWNLSLKIIKSKPIPFLSFF